MRYYSITISPPQDKTDAFAPITYTTLRNDGGVNGAALMVEIDVFQTFFHQPAQIGVIMLYGVDFSQINQSLNLSGANIQLSIGMSSGLPFANPRQAGLVINGTILRAIGNFQGNLVTLELLIVPSTISPDENVNLSFNWIKGQSLTQAVKNTLSTAYPQLRSIGSFSDRLVFTEDQPAQYFKLRTFAKFVNDTSKLLITDSSYLGASVSVNIGGFYLTDGTEERQKLTGILFTDIIGNLTWIDSATIQAKLVMRADLNVGDKLQFPIGSPTTDTPASYSQARNLLAFNGIFTIVQVRHVGNNRNPSANSWVTIVDCVVS